MSTISWSTAPLQEWSIELEGKAKEVSEACNVPGRVETGLNIAYNTSEVPDDYSFATDLMEDWENNRQLSFGTTVTEQLAIS